MTHLFLGGSRDGKRIITDWDNRPIRLPLRDNPINPLDFGKPLESITIKTETYYPQRLRDSDQREYIVFQIESDNLCTIARLIQGYEGRTSPN